MANYQEEAWRFYGQVTTREESALLSTPKLASIAVEHLKQTAADLKHTLWGYVVLPDSVQFVIEVQNEGDYHRFVDAFKSVSETKIIDTILAEYEALIDPITYYNPAWGGRIHHVWQSGYHTQLLDNVYAMSNKIADLVKKPVMLGLVAHPADWSFSSYQQGEDQS